VCETPEEIIVEVELPGIQHEDVRLEVEGEVLRITGERRTTSERRSAITTAWSGAMVISRASFGCLAPWCVRGSGPSSMLAS
jgi:hypothetical protein